MQTLHRPLSASIGLLGIVLAILLGPFYCGQCLAAFPENEVVILEQKDITLLPDDRLIEAYIDVLAEMEASRTFHTTSGFTPKEYKKYKELVKYRLRLLFEIHRRKIELPPLAS